MTEISEYRRRQAAIAGEKARRQGRPVTANSRRFGSIYYDDWMDGWNYADNELRHATPPPCIEENGCEQ